MKLNINVCHGTNNNLEKNIFKLRTPNIMENCSGLYRMQGDDL